MDYSRKISERLWNQPDKGELESRREETYIDDIVQKDHIQRRLLETYRASKRCSTAARGADASPSCWRSGAAA